MALYESAFWLVVLYVAIYVTPCIAYLYPMERLSVIICSNPRIF